MIRAAAPADAPGIARVHVDSWRTTYSGIVPAAYLDNMTYEWRQELWDKILTNPRPFTQAFVAVEDNREIVGFSSVRQNERMYFDYKGELATIYILHEHQGKGLGRALFLVAAGGLLDQGITSMLLWVFVENPARRFYERLGGTLLGEKEFETGGARIREVAYGWLDLTQLPRHTAGRPEYHQSREEHQHE